MNTPLMERIQKKLKDESLSVLRLSKETGISAYRIYKWLEKKGSPKHEDAKKLEQWLRKGVDEIPIGSANGSATVPDVDQFLVSKALKSDAMMETILGVLAEMLAKQLGVPVTSVISQLEKSVLEKEQRIKEELKRIE